MEKLLRYFYTLAFYCALPFIIIRLFWRSRTIPDYRKRIFERLGCFEAPQQKKGIWVHAVSLGEVNAIAPLVNVLQIKYPDTLLTITTMTVTGSQRVRELWGDKVFHVYLPYDVPCFIKNFLRKVQPRLLIVVETELWPNLLHTTHKAGVQLMLANARISERSFLRYQKIQPITKAMLNCFDIIAVQTPLEKQRYLLLGMEETKLQVTGSVKFDMSLPLDLEMKTVALKALVGQRPILIVASTHEGEESIALEAYKAIVNTMPQLLLIIVPRHPERFQRVFDLCNQFGLKVARRSEKQVCLPETQVFLGDSMGELMAYYNISNIAIVGGSFVPVGGHNLLEPAMLAKPILTGPHMHNFVEITRILLEAQGLIQIQDQHALAEAVMELFADPARAEILGKQALSVVEANRGAVLRHLDLIQEMLGS